MNAYSSDPSAPSVVKTPEVELQRNGLERGVEELQKELDGLLDRLESVCVASPPANESSGSADVRKADPHSVVAMHLSVIGFKVADMTRKIRDIKRKLEI